jgi:hypothetical protein
VEGFDSPPVVMMPYSPPYYPELLQGCGYEPIKDLFAWRYDWTEIPDRAKRVVEVLRQLPEVKVRIAQMRHLEEEVRIILDIFNSAWSENWGFVPVTEAEAHKLARDMRLIADPNIIPFVEIAGESAAVAVTLPNLHEAIHDLDGRLFPFGFLKLLWRLKVRGLQSGRVILFGVKKEYRTRRYAGLGYLLCDELYRQAKKRRYKWGDFSWTLEDNRVVNAQIANIGCQHYKTYRIYEKLLKR